MTDSLTISQAVAAYLDHLRATSSSAHTRATYQDALDLFLKILQERQIDPDATSAASLPEQAIAWVLEQPQRGRQVDAHGHPISSQDTTEKPYSPASQRLIVSVLRQFYKFLVAYEYGEFNLEPCAGAGAQPDRPCPALFASIRCPGDRACPPARHGTGTGPG